MTDGYRDGYYCERSFVWVVLPENDRTKSTWNENLVVGHPGFDGVEFQVDEDSAGILAFYPNTDEIGWVAESLEDLVERWKSDRIRFPF